MSGDAAPGRRRLRVVHRTVYEYAAAVDLCHNEAHLEPRSTPLQRRLASRLAIDPPPESSHRRVDYFGNPVAYFAVRLPRRRLTVTAESEVEVVVPEGVDGAGDARRDAPAGRVSSDRDPESAAALADSRHVAGDRCERTGLPSSPPIEEVRARLAASTDPADLVARELVLASPMAEPSDALRDFALSSFPPGTPLFEGAADLARRIHREFAYDPTFSTVATPLAEVLERRRGVCQDFAHVGIACLRALGLPARYVSGYIETVPAPGRPRLRGADASHAWLATYAPGIGWLDLDPTNDQVPPRQHVTTAWGRDYGDVTPLKGVLMGGGEHTLEVSVDVEDLGAL